jgi:hypothetical protein
MIDLKVRNSKYFTDIATAIGSTQSVIDYDEFDDEVVDQITCLILGFRQKVAINESHRRSANKKKRNELTKRISSNSEKLSRGLYKVLTNSTLNREIIDLYQQIVEDDSTSEIFPIADPDAVEYIDVYNFHPKIYKPIKIIVG